MPKSKQPRRPKRKGKRVGGADWSGPATKHGPFGLFSNVKLFYIIGVLIMVGSVVGLGGGASLCSRSNSATPTPVPVADTTETPTPLPGDITPTPTVEQVKQWSAAPAMSIDTAKTYTAQIVVAGKGTIEVELFAADAPNAVNNFVFLAQQGFFNDLPFYYVNPELYAVTGDPSLNPSLTSKGGPGYEIPDEPNTRPFSTGTVAMLEGGDSGMRAGSRFFIVTAESLVDWSGFWPFGQVKSGADVLQGLAQGDTIERIDIAEG